MRLGRALPAGVALVMSLVLVVPNAAWRDAQTPGEASADERPRPAAGTLESFGKLPPLFVENEGQADRDVRFVAQGPGYRFSFRRAAASLALVNGTRGAAIELRFVDADPTAELEARRETPGKVNYFLGNDPAGWRIGLATYEELVYRDLWPGIDLAFHGAAGELKYEFILEPRANVADIRLEYRGADSLTLGSDGGLRIATALGVLSDAAPLSYQEIDGRRVRVESRFILDGGVAFGVGTYDADRPLVIDPGLVYSTLLGGSNVDQGRGIAVDGSGSAVVTGLTASTNFPVSPGAFDATLGDGQDAFVTKLDPTGSALVFSTYLGGTTLPGAPGTDAGHAVALDPAGNIFVTGTTASADFPTLAGFDPSYNGSGDAFVTKFSPTGALLGSTYLGSPGNDQGFGIVVDGSGSPIVTGVTPAAGFPTTLGAYDTSFNGLNDVFITRLIPTLSALVYSTYLGGNASDLGQAVDLDAAGMAIVTGMTAGGTVAFPTTAGAYQPAYGGGPNDAFVTKLSLTGTALIYSTFLGGIGNDQGFGIGIDTVGDPIVTGGTSGGFPTTAGAYDTTYNGGAFDAFVSELSLTGSTLVFSTYLGGTSTDQGMGIAIDAMDRPTITGTTNSASFPTTCGAFDTTYNGAGDIFVTRFDAAGASLVYSTFLGGSGVDNGLAIAVDATTSAYITGQTFPFGAAPYPTTPLAFDTSANGSTDVVVTKLDMIAAATLDLQPPTDTNVVGTPHTVTATLTGVGGGPCPGITVYFSVPTAVATAASPSSGSDVTDANGQATFTYTAALPGMDTIHAFADLNADGDQDTPPEPFNTVTKLWTVPPSTEFCEVTITNGGWIVALNGDRASFGGNAKVGADGEIQGQQQYQDHGPADPRNVHSIELLATTCDTDSDPATATIFGRATIDGSGDFFFRIDVIDGGQGGANDSYGITLSDGYVSGQQQLEGGNVTIHRN
ncbi:MAG TPA: SBBP repeat-containing protein [Candidatus Limnocylindria bacterium]|nr:SBBP repeat-containing protein [Candidatus Limnocylindria bacterium]